MEHFSRQTVFFIAHVLIMSQVAYKSLLSVETLKYYLELSNSLLLACQAVFMKNAIISNLWEVLNMRTHLHVLWFGQLLWNCWD